MKGVLKKIKAKFFPEKHTNGECIMSGKGIRNVCDNCLDYSLGMVIDGKELPGDFFFND